MLTRIAIILTFALQPFWLNVGVARGSEPAECAVTECCEVVEITMCCSEKVIEIVCGETGGECVCVAEPRTPQQPTPAPVQRDLSERMPVLTLRTTGIVVDWVPTPRLGLRAASRIAVPESHNAARALTGVWLT